jgi:hypothetical protein
MVAWLGGAFSVMTLGLASSRERRDHLGLVVRLQGALVRGLVLPGAVTTVITGLMLTLSMYGQATSSGMPRKLMVMQGTGILAAVIVLVITVPTAARLQRLDPVGEYGPLFDALRKRIKLAGLLAGVLGLIALVAGGMR